jgi:hypothetical protein
VSAPRRFQQVKIKCPLGDAIGEQTRRFFSCRTCAVSHCYWFDSWFGYGTRSLSWERGGRWPRMNINSSSFAFEETLFLILPLCRGIRCIGEKKLTNVTYTLIVLATAGWFVKFHTREQYCVDRIRRNVNETSLEGDSGGRGVSAVQRWQYNELAPCVCLRGFSSGWFTNHNVLD